jgi:dipeptidyl aminopeptidase/acylaminoacyl peptidase
MNNRHILVLLIPALLLMASAESACAQDDSSVKRELILDDFGSFRTPETPAISPHGDQIAFVLEDQIYLASMDGQEPRPLTSASSKAMQPHWSADGDSLYFLSDRGDSTQVWMLPVDKFGEAARITEFQQDISSLNLSPDESRLLLEFSDNELEEKPDTEEPQPIVITRRHFKEDADDGYITDGESSHLYVYDIDGESLTQITSGDFEEDEAAWSPDGRSIVFVSNRDDPDATYSNDLWIVAADNRDKGKTLIRLTNNSHTKQSPAWSPDGDQVAYITAVDGVYGLQHIAVVPSAGGEPRILTAGLDRWVTSFEFSGDGDWIYFNYDDSCSIGLARVRVTDAKIERLLEGDYVVSAFDIGKSGVAAILINHRTDTPDVYRLRGTRLNRLTDVNRKLFAEIDLGSKSRVSFASKDGTVVEAFITTPPDYQPQQEYPAILRIHGGPVWQFSWGFDFTSQYLASRGYVVIEPNSRGSTGRGQQYINAIYRNWGMTDYDDVIAAVDYAIEQGIADPDRLGVTGYSYGGYMTNVVITRTDRFKAAASGASESLVAANFGHDIYQKWFMWEFGPPWEHRERYDAVSPILRVANVETPTIFLGGQVDWNMPILNSEAFYQALKIRGIDTQLVVYPGAHHGDWSEEFDKDYIMRIVDWFDKYLASE